VTRLPLRRSYAP